ncbi:hypothetical protein MMC21_007516 [Puttea exsequens]|nr:hypothetical protein [Puttea exsequens]
MVNAKSSTSKDSLSLQPRYTEEQQSVVSLRKDNSRMEQSLQDAMHNLRVAERDNRDQSLQLRDLKRQNTQLQELNTRLLDQVSDLREAQRVRNERLSKNEKSRYIEHLEFLESHIQNLQAERQKRDAHMASLTEQTREANTEKSNLEVSYRKLQKQMRDLSTDLTECKDDLLRLQPSVQISDKEIAEQYNSLDQQIAAWIDENTEDVQLLEERFDAVQDVGDSSSSSRFLFTNDQLKLGKQYPQSQPALLRYHIHNFILEHILSDHIYLFALDSQVVTLFKELESSMHSFEPHRGKLPTNPKPSTYHHQHRPNTPTDITTIRRWRSETLRSLLTIPTFTAEQTSRAESLAKSLHDSLAMWIPSCADDADSWITLQREIIAPAVALSLNLRLAEIDYRFDRHHPHAQRQAHGTDLVSGDTPVFVHELQNAAVIDVATQKAIRPDSNLKIAPNGRIGAEVLTMVPALVRERGEVGGVVVVVVTRPTVLVKLDEPMGRREKGGGSERGRGGGMRALGAWAPGWFGGGGEEAV